MFEFILFTFLYQTNYNTIREYKLVHGIECPFVFKQVLKGRIVTEYNGPLKRKTKILIGVTCRTKKQIVKYGVK